ncbi:hypothetical protein [Vibrio penaeicida]|uniref:hypothetical protein n=1 Tax=Vibrio penaeicida TaxID=104609 RepID=UPI000CE9FD31|nr:hypothetical protein [Vibrio penaeicida]
MIKFKLLMLSLAVSLSPSVLSQTNVLMELRSTPLSMYDAGKNQLKSLVAAVNLMAKMDRNKRDLPYLTVLEDGNRLGVDVQGYERAKKITDKFCNESFKKLSSLGISSDIPKILWPSLSESDALQIQKELFVQVTLVAKENHNFSVSCSKSLAEI